MKSHKIAFQGHVGSYSEQCCHEIIPDAEILPCKTFDKAFEAVQKGEATHAVIPIDNNLVGRVADVHRLLPESGLSIIGEHYLPIRHALLGVKGAKLEDIKEVFSHLHAIPQCQKFLKEHGLAHTIFWDTAGSAKEVSERQDKTIAAIASPLAAEIYNLDIIKEDIQDADYNMTRFVLLAQEQKDVPPEQEGLKTTFIFRVKNIPGALHKALGCFADRDIQMTKLESYVGQRFEVALFLSEIKGNYYDGRTQRAFEALKDFTEDIKILGCYEAKL